MLSNNIRIESLAATPFKHDITVAGLGIKAGSTKQLPPPFIFQYYFGDASSKFRPYASLGINTTIFFEEEIDAELNAALDGIVGLPAGTEDASLELDRSWVLAAQARFDYMLNDKRVINGAIWYTGINTDTTIHTAVADLVR
ncbi:MAG: outer membrane protein [Candidatus Azotimanducaceae bacterium]|jgi:outer membrane protein